MQETGNNNNTERLIIRISNSSMAFAFKDQENGNRPTFIPYKMKNGISVAANLREAMKDEALGLSKWQRVMVLMESPTVMVPIDEYNEQDRDTIYHYSVTEQENCDVLATALGFTGAVALYSFNRDLKLVLADNFADIRINPLCMPVWQHLYRRSMSGSAEKLYCYFHDGRMDICSFRKNRFRFCNSFPATHTHDAVYYLLSVWQQLALNAQKDEIYTLGDFAEYDALTDELHHFVENVYKIKATADFNRHPATQIPGIPFDLAVLMAR